MGIFLCKSSFEETYATNESLARYVTRKTIEFMTPEEFELGRTFERAYVMSDPRNPRVNIGVQPVIIRTF